MEDSTIEDSPKQRNWPIYLYIPNIIGYARIIANVAAFGVAFTNKKLFAILYFARYSQTTTCVFQFLAYESSFKDLYLDLTNFLL